MKKKRELYARIGLGIFGIILVLMGIFNIIRGELNYTNYCGGIVFAPVAIIIGILILIIVFFRWRTMNQLSEESKLSGLKEEKRNNWKKW